MVLTMPLSALATFPGLMYIFIETYILRANTAVAGARQVQPLTGLFNAPVLTTIQCLGLPPACYGGGAHRQGQPSLYARPLQDPDMD